MESAITSPKWGSWYNNFEGSVSLNDLIYHYLELEKAIWCHR